MIAAMPGRPATADIAVVDAPTRTYPVEEPTREAGRPAPRSRRWWTECLFATGLYVVYEVIRAVVAGSPRWAQRDGHDILRWEQLAHLDPEHWLNHALQGVGVLAVPACYFYAAAYMIVTPGVLIWLYRTHPERYGQARWTLALVTFVALVGFRWFPTAPPRLLSGAGFADTLGVYHGWGWWGPGSSVPAAASALANQDAAMPSLHVAWAVWCGAAVFALTRHRVVRALAILYPLLTALDVLATANHYLLDVLAGATLWLLTRLAVGRVAALRRCVGSPPCWIFASGRFRFWPRRWPVARPLLRSRRRSPQPADSASWPRATRLPSRPPPTWTPRARRPRNHSA